MKIYRSIIIGIYLTAILINGVFSYDSSEGHRETRFFGSVQTEKGTRLNGYDFFIKDINDPSITYCQTTSTETTYRGVEKQGHLYLNCNLKDGEQYKYMFYNPQGKVIQEGSFKKDEGKDVYTIGPEGYNDIKIGVYSKNENISIFSPEYKELEEREFELLVNQPDSEGGSFGKVYSVNFSFICKDDKKAPKDIPYTLKVNKEIREDGLGSGLHVTLRKKEIGILFFEDGKDKKQIEISKLNKEGTIFIENCNKNNSVEKEKRHLGEVLENGKEGSGIINKKENNNPEAIDVYRGRAPENNLDEINLEGYGSDNPKKVSKDKTLRKNLLIVFLILDLLLLFFFFHQRKKKK